MTIFHSPANISFVRRRESLACHRRESQSLQGEDPDDDANDSAWTRKDPPVSRIVSRNRLMNTQSDTLFAAFPVELRVEIFLQYCGMYCPIDKSTEGPIMLLKVCRAWKELALQTPQLWASFALDFTLIHGLDKRHFFISAMKEWINRSRNLPLSFELHYEYAVFDATSTPLIQCILPSSHRWRDINLHAPSDSLLPLWEVGFPSLRNLAMDSTGLSIHALKNLAINWAQITELNLFLSPTPPTLDECLDILKRVVNLTRCTINAICGSSSHDLDRRLHLPRMEHLGLSMYGGEIGGRRETKFMEFLGALSPPALQSLSIRWTVEAPGPNQPYYWSDSGYAKLIHFLGELREHLTSLHLAYLPFTTRQLIGCLGVVRALKHLDLTLSRADMVHDSINDEFLGALTQRSGASTLVPLLRSIRLESNGESFSNTALFRFIASRWKYQESLSGELESLDLVSSSRQAQYHPWRFEDLKVGKLDVRARLRSEFSMLAVLSPFLDRDSYGEMICFLNGDFSSNIRSLLIFG
ncbi:hypothetical protein DFH07DRAFT_405098 [Mycena maculata]|uniref:F-box domain-containing protein n=1 Tax=Mycena maculata TaxID=230809 RepID=A0AAD7JGH5_9AGAR|nr:hypothetical protein DFH07DRAFT_405098 [Mycena maculata]